jgi:hypothetical protein
MSNKQARSSAGPERFLDTEEVDGSNPFGPTIVFTFSTTPNLYRGADEGRLFCGPLTACHESRYLDKMSY